MSVEEAKARLATLADATPEEIERAEAFRRFLDVQYELEQRLSQGGLEVYGWPKEKIDWPNFGHPNPRQEAFHASKALVRLLVGANRSGKSQAGCAEDAAYAIGVRPWLPADHPNYFVDVKIPNKGLLLGESFGEQVRKVFNYKLLGDEDSGQAGLLAAGDVLDTKRNHMGVICTIKVRVHPDAARRAGIRFKRIEDLPVSTISLMSYEQEVKLFEGHDYDWCHFDEPPPRKVFIAVKRGLTDRMGPCWFTMTPLKEAWIKREVIAKPGVDSFTMDIEDNLGFGLTREAIDEFTKYLSEDEREMRLRGKFFHLVGAVYKNLNANIHRVPRKVLPAKIPLTWGVWMHADTHDRVPHHAVWICVRPDGFKFVFGAIKNEDRQNRLKPFAEQLRDYELSTLGIHPDHEIRRLIDPIADTPNPTDEAARTFIDFLREYGLHFRKGSKKRADGIRITREEFGHDLQAIPPVWPSLYIVDDLEEVWSQLEEYRWSDYTGPALDHNNPREEPVKKDDHYVEGIHRILLDNPYATGFEEEDYEPPAAHSAGSGFARGY